MPSYLLIAYVVFVLFPLGLALSIVLRRRRVERQIAALRERIDETLPLS